MTTGGYASCGLFDDVDYQVVVVGFGDLATIEGATVLRGVHWCWLTRRELFETGKSRAIEALG